MQYVTDTTVLNQFPYQLDFPEAVLDDSFFFQMHGSNSEQKFASNKKEETLQTWLKKSRRTAWSKQVTSWRTNWTEIDIFQQYFKM